VVGRNVVGVKYNAFCLVTLLALALMPIFSCAVAPHLISLQGRALYKNGTVAANAPVNATLWLQATGGSEVPGYEGGEGAASDANGAFQLLLGSTKPLNLLYNQLYYMQLMVGGEVVDLCTGGCEAFSPGSNRSPFYATGGPLNALELNLSTGGSVEATLLNKANATGYYPGLVVGNATNANVSTTLVGSPTLQGNVTVNGSLAVNGTSSFNGTLVVNASRLGAVNAVEGWADVNKGTGLQGVGLYGLLGWSSNATGAGIYGLGTSGALAGYFLGGVSITGNVSIGTSPSSYPLDVAGNIHCTGSLLGCTVDWALIAGAPDMALYLQKVGGAASSLTITGSTINDWLKYTKQSGAPISCNAASEGTQYYSTSGAMFYCNGSSWTQLAISGSGLTGSGTTNYLPKWTGSTALGNSSIYETGGSIGIGTTSPSEKLNVNGSLRVDDSTGSAVLLVNATSGNYEKSGFTCDPYTTAIAYKTTAKTCGSTSCTQCTTGSHDWSPTGNYQETCQARNFFISCGSYYTCYANPYVRCEYIGRVGIGTTSPSERLNVNGSLRVDNSTGSAILLVNAISGNVGIISGSVGIGTASPSDYLDVRSITNPTGITVSAPNNAGAGSQPALQFKRYNTGVLNTTARIYSGACSQNAPTCGDLVFSTGTTASPADNMIITATGNVGIGTATPNAKLDVAGNLKISDSSSTCDSSHRGEFRFVGGNPDILYMCMKDSASSYNWIMVARGS
jgi:hypothetical protein